VGREAVKAMQRKCMIILIATVIISLILSLGIAGAEPKTPYTIDSHRTRVVEYNGDFDHIIAIPHDSYGDFPIAVAGSHMDMYDIEGGVMVEFEDSGENYLNLDLLSAAIDEENFSIYIALSGDGGIRLCDWPEGTNCELIDIDTPIEPLYLDHDGTTLYYGFGGAVGEFDTTNQSQWVVGDLVPDLPTTKSFRGFSPIGKDEDDNDWAVASVGCELSGDYVCAGGESYGLFLFKRFDSTSS
jgi:hypothetical protein